MTRGQLARQTGCNAETIRYYEHIGLMPEPRRGANGYRRYDQQQARRLRFIMRGRELGFSIDELKGLLRLVDRDAVSCAQVEALARRHLQAVRSRIADLRRIERVLDETLAACSGDDVPECALIDTLYGELDRPA